MFGWLTRRLVAGLPSRREAAVLERVSAQGLHFLQANGRKRVVRWDAVELVTAALSPELVGDTAMLVFGLAGGGSVVATAADPGWETLTETLHLRLTGAARAAVWQLKMLDEGQVEVYCR